MKKNVFLPEVLILIIGLPFYFTSCASTSGATTGGNYEELAAQGVDVFAGKNWNAPRRNNMYDRWEFNTDGTFHFVHVHHGSPLDRGIYRYEAKDGLFTVAKERTEEHASYTYTFKGKTVTLTPVSHDAAGHGHGHEQAEGHHQMGALPESPVTFTNAK